MTDAQPHNQPPTEPRGGSAESARKERPHGSITVHPLAEHAVPGLPPDREAIRVLEDSYALLKPHAGRLTQEFYRRLFEAHPQLRSMFPAEIALQEKKLADTLEAVIDGLRDPAGLREKVKSLGKLHADKGVVAGQYPVVTKLIIEVAAEIAGPAWTPSVQHEWRRALEQISAIMIHASGRGGAAG